MHRTSPRPRPRLLSLLLAQLADGFGARFHGVLLSLYLLRVGGLGAFASLTASGMLGIVMSLVAAGGLTRLLGGQRTMRLCALLLGASRIATYGIVALGGGVIPLLALRLIGSTAASLMTNAAKAQVPDGRDGRGGASSLAWMSVANAFGQTLAAAVAGLVSLQSPWLIAALGAPMAALPTVPMIRLARYATAQVLTLPEQLTACRHVAPAAFLCAAVNLFVAGLGGLKDGLTVDLYSERWLGAVAAASLAGSLVTAAVLPRVAHVNAHPKSDFLVWPLLGALCLVGWAFADIGVEWLLASQFLGGIAGQALAAFTEARILSGAGRDGAVPALTVSGSASACAGAISAVVVPPLLAHLGYGGAAAVFAAPLVLLAAFGAWRLAVRTPCSAPTG